MEYVILDNKLGDGMDQNVLDDQLGYQLGAVVQTNDNPHDGYGCGEYLKQYFKNKGAIPLKLSMI